MFSRRKSGKSVPGYFQAKITEDNIIDAQVKGFTSEAVMRDIIDSNKRMAAELRAKGHPALALFDVSKTTGQSSEARTYGKEHMGRTGMDKIALYGANRGVVLVAKYLSRSAGVDDTMGFFRTRAQAKQWLLQGSNSAQTDMAVRNVATLLIILLAGGALVGWYMDIPVLKSIVPSLTPMNPVAAVTFILAAIAMMSLKKGAIDRRRKQYIAIVMAWMTLFGTAGILHDVTNTNFHLDAWLFTNELGTTVKGGHVSLAVAIGFIVLAGMFWAVQGGAQKRLRQYVFHILSCIVFAFSLTLLIAGYGFGVHWLHTFYTDSPIALNTLIVFLLFANGLQVVAVYRPFFRRVGRIINAYWQPALVFLMVFFATGLAWQQAKTDVTRNVETAVNSAYASAEGAVRLRMSTYTNSLGGFRALFAASNEVDPHEFSAYLKSSELATQYPGFGSITYVAVVPNKDKAAFTDKARSYTSTEFPQYKDFTIYPASNQAVSYPLVFASNPASVYGFDLASEQVRRTTLEKARDSGKPQSSGVIQFNASRGINAPGNHGFFITVPVYGSTAKEGTAPANEAARRANINGFVLAYFVPTSLFPDIFESIDRPDVRYTITDMTSKVQLYQSKAPDVSAQAETYKTGMIDVAGDKWRLSMQVLPGFGHSNLDHALPQIVFIGGTLLSLLAGLLVFGQIRRRDQAMDLAARITEDLNHERNEAVAVQQKDEAILSSIGDAVFAIDTNEKITLLNPVAEHISGFTRDEAVGRPYKEILHFLYEGTDKVNEKFVRRALAGHITAMHDHTILLRKDGTRIAVADSAAPIRNAKGKILGAIIVFRDVSKEQELDRAKTEFVSLASHQLRTPLSAINWYSEMLLNGDAGSITAEQKEYLQEIYEGNQRMIELVNSLLDVSRLDLGKLTNEPVPTDMSAIVASIHKELKTSIAHKKHHLTLAIAKKFDLVLADPKLLRMVVQNLMSNAVKYTSDNGTIVVTLRPAHAEEILKAGIRKTSGDYFLFSVADNGFGIPKEEQAHIFSKLFRADNVRELDVEGTGLGLYIVKEVVEKLGGRVWFESVEHKGTTFFVVMPFKTPHRKPTPHA